MIAHDRIREDVDGENVGEQLETLDQPGFAVIETAPGATVFATQERAANAAGNAVIKRRGGEGDELFAVEGVGGWVGWMKRSGGVVGGVKYMGVL